MNSTFNYGQSNPCMWTWRHVYKDMHSMSVLSCNDWLTTLIDGRQTNQLWGNNWKTGWGNCRKIRTNARTCNTCVQNSKCCYYYYIKVVNYYTIQSQPTLFYDTFIGIMQHIKICYHNTLDIGNIFTHTSCQMKCFHKIHLLWIGEI